MDHLLRFIPPHDWLTVIAVGGFFLGLIAGIVGYRFKRASLTKRPPAFFFCIVTWTLSIVAAIASIAFYPSADLGLAIAYGGVSAMVLLTMLLLPVMHQKSGFRPAEVHFRLLKLGPQHEAVLQEVRQFFESSGFDLLDGTSTGYSFVAVPSLKELPSWNPHIGQVRTFVKVVRDSWDVDFVAVVDTKEYVMSVTWETEATRGIARRVEQFMRARYGDAIAQERNSRSGDTPPARLA